MAGPSKSASKLRVPSVGALAIIGLVIGASAAAFAYTARWFSPHRLTPERMVEALSQRGGNPLGHRRNHAKGICFTGEFAANGAGARLSTAAARRRPAPPELRLRRAAIAQQ